MRGTQVDLEPGLADMGESRGSRRPSRELVGSSGEAQLQLQGRDCDGPFQTSVVYRIHASLVTAKQKIPVCPTENENVSSFQPLATDLAGSTRQVTPNSTLNQSILKEINPEYSLERVMLKLQYFGHLIQTAGSLGKTLTRGNMEDRRRGQQRARWMATLPSSGHHQLDGHEFEQSQGDGRTGEPAVLQSLGSHRVGHDLATEQQIHPETMWECGWALVNRNPCGFSEASRITTPAPQHTYTPQSVSNSSLIG